METELAASPPSTPPAPGLPPDAPQVEPPPERPGRPPHQQPHQCGLCGRGFAQAHGLRQHRCRSRGPPARSPGDGEPFSAEAAPGSHRCGSGAKRGHPCQVCGKQFKFPYYLARHGLTHNGQKPFQCPVCHKAFRRPAHLARHQRTHARQCPCPQRPPEPDERLGRQAGPPGEGRADEGAEEKQVLLQEDWTLLCLACQEAFETKGELKAHKCFKARGRAGADGTKRHQCSVCHKFFARPWSLSRHHLVHTGEKPFACPDCGMAFRLSSYLKQHSRSHGAGGQPFACPLCRQRFRTPAELALHQRGHEEDAPPVSCGGAEEPGATPRKGYGCSVCGKAFKSKYDLATHFLIHTGELPYQCGQCGKRFRRLSHLKQHHVTHTGARPFQCVLCQKEFKRLADLARHRQVHEGDKPHQCGVCHKFFSRAYSLLRHQRGHQPGLLAGARPEAFLSNSCFDSQDHSAFCTPEEEEEEEWGVPGGSGQGS